MCSTNATRNFRLSEKHKVNKAVWWSDGPWVERLCQSCLWSLHWLKPLGPDLSQMACEPVSGSSTQRPSEVWLMGNSKSTSSVSSHGSILKGQTSQGCQGMSGAGNRLWQSWELPETGDLDLALPSAMGWGVRGCQELNRERKEKLHGDQRCWFYEEAGSDLLILLSCFVLFYHESQTMSLHSKMAVSTPELQKSIQELIVLNDSTLPNFHEPSSHCL